MSHMDIERERIIELCLKYGDPEVAEMLQEDAIEDALVQGVPPSSLPPVRQPSVSTVPSPPPRNPSVGTPMFMDPDDDSGPPPAPTTYEDDDIDDDDDGVVINGFPSRDSNSGTPSAQESESVPVDITATVAANSEAINSLFG